MTTPIVDHPEPVTLDRLEQGQQEPLPILVPLPDVDHASAFALTKR